MSLGEMIGYVASALVFCTFYVRTMFPLRIIAIASNFAFIVYASLEGLAPILILHLMLLPINATRLFQIQNLISFTRSNPDVDNSVEALLPFMKPQKLAKGELLFSKGDFSSHMYYLQDGKIRLEEINKAVASGTLLGEMGLFSPNRQRTATAVAETDCRLLSIDDKSLYQAYYQNPKLGFYLIKLIMARILENNDQSPPSQPEGVQSQSGASKVENPRVAVDGVLSFPG